MTIADAITQCDNIKPNQYDKSVKLRWLSDLDGQVKKEIIDTHAGGDLITFTAYDDTTDLSTALLIPDPYSDVYIKYLFTQIDFNNAEFARYNNSMVMYNTAYLAYAKYYNRTVMPL